MPGKTDTNSTPADTSRFATTHWSLVLAAGDSASLQREQAMKRLDAQSIGPAGLKMIR
jgi:hypothetical protein